MLSAVTTLQHAALPSKKPSIPVNDVDELEEGEISQEELAANEAITLIEPGSDKVTLEGLAPKITPDLLYTVFSQYGTVLSVTLQMNRQKRTRAQVQYTSHENALKAIHSLSDSVSHPKLGLVKVLPTETRHASTQTTVPVSVLDGLLAKCNLHDFLAVFDIEKTLFLHELAPECTLNSLFSGIPQSYWPVSALLLSHPHATAQALLAFSSLSDYKQAHEYFTCSQPKLVYSPKFILHMQPLPLKLNSARVQTRMEEYGPVSYCQLNPIQESKDEVDKASATDSIVSPGLGYRATVKMDMDQDAIFALLGIYFDHKQEWLENEQEEEEEEAKQVYITLK